MTEGGVKFAPDCGGNPLTLRLTVPLRPAELTVIVVLPELPFGTVKFDPEIEKPPPDDAALTVTGTVTELLGPLLPPLPCIAKL